MLIALNPRSRSLLFWHNKTDLPIQKLTNYEYLDLVLIGRLQIHLK